MSARATSNQWVWKPALTMQPEDGRFRHDLAVRSGADWNDRSPPTAADFYTIKDGPPST